MKKRVIYTLLALIVSVAGLGCFAQVRENMISAVTSAPPAQTKPVTEEPKQDNANEQAAKAAEPVHSVNPLSVVKNPNAYLNKRINVVTRFGKFATLGLDYKPAFRSSETYISFLIFRPDTDKNIPLSEMKLFIKRSAAEKLIDLKEGDKVQFSGTVFSNALGDAWVDVDNLSKVSSAK